MKMLLALVLLTAWPAAAQVAMVGAPCKITDGSCAGAQGSSYNSTTDTTTLGTVAARNVTATALPTPGAITVTPQGTGGVVTWTYKLVATLSDGTTTEAGAASSTAVGNANLGAVNFNRLTWSAVTGATGYKVYRTVTGTTPLTTGIIYTGTALTVDDVGLAGGGETAPTVNGTGVVTGRGVLGTGTTVTPGTGTATALVSGTLYVSTTSATTTGTAEEILATYTMPANTLAVNGQTVRITAMFATAANANSKIARIRFGGIGGTIVATQTTTASGAGWIVEAIVFRTGAATQVSYGKAVVSGSPTTSTAAPTATLSGTVDIVATGLTATAAGDVTLSGLIVEALN